MAIQDLFSDPSRLLPDSSVVLMFALSFAIAFGIRHFTLQKRSCSFANSEPQPGAIRVDKVQASRSSGSPSIDRVMTGSWSSYETAKTAYNEAVASHSLLIAKLRSDEVASLLTHLCIAAVREGDEAFARRMLSDATEGSKLLPVAFVKSLTRVLNGRRKFGTCIDFHKEFMYLSGSDPRNSLQTAVESGAEMTVLSCLLHAAVEVRDSECSQAVFDVISSNVRPTSKDVGNIIRSMCQQGKWKESVTLLHQMESRHAGDESIQDQAQIAVDRPETPDGTSSMSGFSSEYVADIVAYNMVVSCCVESGQLEEATRLVSRLTQSASKPAFLPTADVVTYNILVKGLVKSSWMAVGVSLVESMMSDGAVCPNDLTFITLLDGVTDLRSGDTKPLSAEKVAMLDRVVVLVSRHVGSGKLGASGTLVNSVLKCLCRTQDVKRVNQFMDFCMSNPQCNLDIVSFNLAIKANSDKGDITFVTAMLKSLAARNISPDEIICNNVLSSCVPEGDTYSAFCILDLMSSTYNVRPSVATCSILISVLVSAAAKDRPSSVQLTPAAEYGQRTRETGNAFFDRILTLLVETFPTRFETRVQVRLFVQAIHAAIKLRVERAVVELVSAMTTVHLASTASGRSDVSLDGAYIVSDNVVHGILTTAVSYGLGAVAIETVEVLLRNKIPIPPNTIDEICTGNPSRRLGKYKSTFVSQLHSALTRSQPGASSGLRHSDRGRSRGGPSVRVSRRMSD